MQNQFLKTRLFALRCRPDRALGRGLRKLGMILVAWQERARQRRHLAELPEYLLKDIGLGRAEVLEATAKPFWRL